MAYNYSPWFLIQNEEAVRRLVALAKDAEVGATRFESPDEARAYRLKILSLLACLARNHPDMAWVKNRLRTWISYDGWYTVCVGVPPSHLKLRGPKPAAITVGEAVKPELPEPTATIRRLVEVRDWGEFSRLTADQSIQEITVIEPPSPEVIQNMREVMPSQTGFEVIEESPHLILRRSNDVGKGAGGTS